MPRWVGLFRFHGLLGDCGDAPAAVLQDGAVWDSNRAARALGVRPGQSAAAARTVCLEATWTAFDPAAMADRLTGAWRLLAEAAACVEPDPDGRPQAYAAWPAGPPPRAEVAALVQAARDALPHVDLAAGLADSRLLAAAARPPEQGIAWAEGPRARARLLAALPLADLAAQGLIATPLLHRLHDMALYACGQVAELPEPALLARFGRDGSRLRALCLGQDPRPVHALYPPRSLRARRAFPDGLPPERWTAVAADLARRAAAGLRQGEGVRSLHLLGAGGGERTRGWKSPHSGIDLLARAAAALAAEATRTCREPAGALEVVLADLDALPIRPLDLFAAGRPDGQALDGLLERLPRQVLRRGCGGDGGMRPVWLRRHEAMLAFLDPWRVAP